MDYFFKKQNKHSGDFLRCWTTETVLPIGHRRTEGSIESLVQRGKSNLALNSFCLTCRALFMHILSVTLVTNPTKQWFLPTNESENTNALAKFKKK